MAENLRIEGCGGKRTDVVIADALHDDERTLTVIEHRFGEDGETALLGLDGWKQVRAAAENVIRGIDEEVFVDHTVERLMDLPQYIFIQVIAELQQRAENLQRARVR